MRLEIPFKLSNERFVPVPPLVAGLKYVIAATNKPEMIDSAILRSGRIELKFFISEPDYETRIQLFLEYVKNRNVNKNIDYNFLARLTDNYVTADIKLIVDTAARLAFRQKKEFIELDGVKWAPGNLYQTADGEAARNDKDYMYVSCWKYTGDNEKPVLLKEPLKYEAIQVQTRNYKS